MFIHCVYFWLRDDLSSSDRDTFIDGVHSLLEIDTVRHGYVGRPAGTDRPVIDTTYSYGLVVVFDDRHGHDVYQDDPIHDRFRDRCGNFWTDVKIYDVES